MTGGEEDDKADKDKGADFSGRGNRIWAAILASDRYQMPDDLRFLIFLAAYLLAGIEAFGRFRDNLMKKRF